jgi:FkbM family methyltransferase
LQANLARNNVSTARAVNVAAADGRQTLQVFLAPEGNIGRTSVQNWNSFVEDWHGFAVECEIEALPLGEILTREEIVAARLLKIDVEGSEWAVISGMEDVLAGSRPDLEIIVEISPETLARYGKSVADIFAVFGKQGFFPYRLANDYTLDEYLRGGEKTRPARIREPIIRRQTDVVFSRRNQEML